MAISMLVVLLLLAGVHAQSPASSPELPSPLGPSSSLGPASYLGPSSSLGPASAPTVCSTELLGLSDCLSYVSKGSNTTVPDKGCCPGLSGLVDNAPQCLCQLIGKGEVLGLPIDKKKSLELPTACHVTTPPISLCSLLEGPASSPTPAPSSGGGPSSGGAPSGGLEIPTSSTPASYLGPSSSLGPASAPTDCSTELLGLSDCLSYVSKGSNTTVPDKGCCPGLSGLVDNAPQCLCQIIGKGEVLGLPIDKKKSLELPTACHVTTPPISLCSLLEGPVSSPTPAPSSGGGPSSGGAPSGGLEIPTSSTPALSPSSSRGSRGFRACNVFFFVALFFTGVSLIIF